MSPRHRSKFSIMERQASIVRQSMKDAIDKIDFEILEMAGKIDLLTAPQLAEWKERQSWLRQYRDNLDRELNKNHPSRRERRRERLALLSSSPTSDTGEADPTDGRLLQAAPRQARTGEARLPRRRDAGSPDRQVDQAIRKGARLIVKDGSRLHNQLKNTALPGFRHCYDCEQDLPLADFYATTRHLSCRSCIKKRSLARYYEKKAKKAPTSPQDALESAIALHASSG